MNLAASQYSTFTPQTTTVIQNGGGQDAMEAGEKKSKGFSFGDFLDVINPLHHIPIVGHVYRAITGDEIKDGARLAGGGLFGGPLGVGLAAAGLALEKAAPETTGALANLFRPASDTEEPRAQVAAQEAQTPSQPQPAIPTLLTHPALSQNAIAALAQSMSPEIAAQLKQKMEDAPAAQDEREQPPAVPAPQVLSQGPVSQPGALPSTLLAQMAQNLDKYDALTQP